jgi:hypothetical protein
MHGRAVVVAGVLMLAMAFGEGIAMEGGGGHGGAFLRLPLGARPAGMGNAFVGVADDASALYFNPGGLYQIEGSLFGAMYSVLSLDRQHFQASFAHSYGDYGSFGLMITKFGVSDIERRDSQGNPSGSFDDSELAVGIGYAKEIYPRLGAGGAIKYITHSLDANGATGVGFDGGALCRLPVDHPVVRSVRFGFSVSNLMASLSWDTSSSRKEDIPSTLRFGTGLELSVREIPFLAVFEGSRTLGESFEFHGGLEVWPHELFCVRAGADGNNLDFGISVKYHRLRTDYSLSADELEDGATSKIGIEVAF